MVRAKLLLEQFVSHQALLFQKPDKEEPRDQPDDVPFRATLAGAVIREAAGFNSSFEPAEQLLVEATVQRLDVEHTFPGGVKVIEIANALDHETGQRQIAQNLDMCPVRTVRGGCL